MNKTYINIDTNIEDLRKIYQNNRKLQQEVSSDYEESEMHYISEILDSFRNSLKDYSIGFCQYNYIKVNSNKDFLEGLQDAQNKYCFLQDKYNEYIDMLIVKCSEFDNMGYDNKNYDHLNEWLDKKIDMLSNIVIEQFNILTGSPSLEMLKEYFVEFYADSRLDTNSYYDNDYKLYTHVEYEKSYN